MVNCPHCNKKCKNQQGLTQHTVQVHAAKGQRPRNVKAPKIAYGGGANLVNGINIAAGTSKLPADIHFPNLLASAMGRTPTGRAWAMTALHPCGKGEIISPMIGDLSGMPDTMTGAVVTPAYPGENYITFDTTLFETPPMEPTGTWGIDVIIPPIPEIDFLYRIRYDLTNLESRWRVVRLPNMGLPTAATSSAENIALRGVTFASLGYGKVRCIGSGHTFNLDVSDLNNQGRIVAAQIDGQWSDLKLPFGRSNAVTGQFVTGPALTDLAPAVTAVNVQSSAYGNTDLQVLSIPVDPQVLVSACPSSYQADAKFGAYVVQKFSSPLLGYQFKQAGDDAVFATDGGEVAETAVEGLAPMTAFGINTTGYNQTIPVVDNLEILMTDSDFDSLTATNTVWPVQDNTVAGGLNDDAGKVIHPFVTKSSDMMTSVITFRNLAVASTGSSTAVVRVKSRNFFECIPNAQNPATTPFTHQPAAYDPPALDAVITVGKQLADAYPASYNDLGEMLGQMWDGLKELVHPVAVELGKAGIPVVSNIAAEIGDSLHTSSDRLNAMMSRASHVARNTAAPSALAAMATPIMGLSKRAMRGLR
jgi:hypothetical protein